MQRSRLDIRHLKTALKAGDAQAATILLAHSLAFGHPRLSVKRYLQAKALGAPDLASFSKAIEVSTRRLDIETIFIFAQDALVLARKNKGGNCMNRDGAVMGGPLILSFDGVSPKIGAEQRLLHDKVSILGKVTIGARATCGPFSVIRADGHYVQIGNDLVLGERATVHIAHEVYPTKIGNNVCVGRNAVVHACEVANDCIVDENAVVLDGSVIEDRVVVEAQAVVFPRSILKSGFVYSGSPAVAVRELSSQDLLDRRNRIEREIAHSLFRVESQQSIGPRTLALGKGAFVADTATINGIVRLKHASSVFFSCSLDAGAFSIEVGENTNIQDNTTIRCLENSVSIGRDTTIGHNVEAIDCFIGDRALVGIGSVLAAGTVIEDDVLLAAGSHTEPGQRLSKNAFWAGRPARLVSDLNAARKEMLAQIVSTYCDYATKYARLQGQDRSA